MTDPADRLRFVLNGTTFPAERWELIARAEYYGADPATLRELQSLEQRRYAWPHRHHRGELRSSAG